MKKLLMVEDSNFFRSVVEKRLKKVLDIDVVFAGSLSEARDILRDGLEHYFLALLDLVLPDAPDGEIVDLVQDTGLPVIVFSSTFDEALRERLMSRKVIDYIVKDSQASLGYLTWIVQRLYRNGFVQALVVDDSETARHYLRDLLTLYQFTVHEAESAHEALDIVAENPGIRLIVTDYNMPGMDGFELITTLRETYARDELAIIGISANGNAPTSAKFIKYGANDFLNKPFFREEFFCRICQNMDMLDNAQALADAARKDFLTDLPNRRCFFETSATLLSAARRAGSRPLVALLDIDHFKRINDTYGHDAGDDVLIGVARQLESCMQRDSDIAARIGGEEFAIFAYDLAGHAVIDFFESIRRSIAESHYPTTQGPLQVTVSIGVCSNGADNIEDMLKIADERLYRAKQTGRNRVCFG